VLPGITVFGLGIAFIAAPVTSAVLNAVPEERAGAASGTNNAVSRIAGLLAVAILPPLTGIAMRSAGAPLGPGFAVAVAICAVLCLAGSILAMTTIGGGAPTVVRGGAG